MVTGGGRSGKSRYALERAARYPGRRVFVATAEPFDAEMRARIAEHRRGRGPGFETIEEPRDLAGAIRRIGPGAAVALIDCLTVWLGNLMHHGGEGAREFPELAAFIAALRNPPCDLIAVSNEVGMGIIPTDSAASRAFRDQAGWLNQEVARAADEVVLVVSGIPVVIKDSGKEREQ
jgi:adenosylcobinamide kinase/adenosylcobinamide-phosphate guanylyltransferase